MAHGARPTPLPMALSMDTISRRATVASPWRADNYRGVAERSPFNWLNNERSGYQ